jgi:hypothetical protein
VDFCVECNTIDLLAYRSIHLSAGKLLAYNCSPSFNWKKLLSDEEIASFQKRCVLGQCCAVPPDRLLCDKCSSTNHACSCTGSVGD